jgi:DNA-binding response OmpR family regulator
MKILMVEDDRWFADSLRNTMLGDTAGDIEIKTCHSAEKAIDLVDAFLPDVILLDIMLGDKNGLVLLNELQSYIDTRVIPIVILSLNATQVNQNDLAQFGVHRVLDKSIATIDEIIESCKSAVGSSATYV